MLKTFGIALLSFFSVFSIVGKPIIRIEVSAGSATHTNLPVSMLVAELGTVSVKKIRLIEVAEGKRVEKPFQLIDDTEPRIYWKLDGRAYLYTDV